MTIAMELFAVLIAAAVGADQGQRNVKNVDRGAVAPSDATSLLSTKPPSDWVPPTWTSGAVAADISTDGTCGPIGVSPGPAGSSPHRLVSGFLSGQRMNAELFTVVALIGLVIAAAGIYSVTNLAVNKRQREIGIRIAIGAYRREIARMVITHAMGAVLLGLGLGLACAFGVTRLVRGLLFGVGSTDPATFTTGIVVLLAAAILAAYLPIRRAVRVDPMILLRNE